MRKQIAAILSVFILGVFGYSSVVVYDWYFGVPKGLTGGRSKVYLPGKGSLKVDGGFVRSVEGFQLVLRAVSPRVVLEFENRGSHPSSFPVELLNVRATPIRAERIGQESPEGEVSPFPFDRTGPSAIRFDLELPPSSTATLRFEQIPETPGEVRFFVFGHVRNGELYFRQLQDIANHEAPDFMFCLGDTYYRTFVDKILDFDRQLGTLRVPVFLIRGEIEYRDQDEPAPGDAHPLAQFYHRDRHPTIFGPGNSVFEFGGWKFVVVENGRERNIVSFDWLESLPAENSFRGRTIFLSHIPPYDPRTTISKDVTTGNPNELAMMVKEMERLGVAAGFFSHYRWYEERKVGDIPTYTTSVSLPKIRGGHIPHFLDVTLKGGEVHVTRRTLIPSDVAEERTRSEESGAQAMGDGEDKP